MKNNEEEEEAEKQHKRSMYCIQFSFEHLHEMKCYFCVYSVCELC